MSLRVLIVTGDRAFRPGHPRFDLQAECVSRLEAIYWGAGSMMPPVPPGPYDVVSVQDPFLRGLYALGLARSLHARFNVQIHADISAQPLWKRIIAGFVVRNADSIRAVSEKTKNQAQALKSRAPVSVLPLYVDAGRFSSVARAPEHPPVILWTGRFEEEKDPLRAVRVFAEVRKRGIDARLILLGAGSLEARLMHAARDLPVEFPGWQQDVTPYLAKASVVLSTSRAESWGASIVEALAAGVPVAAPDVGVAREAGAKVVPREKLPDAVAELLSQKADGSLKVQLLSRSEWQEAWKKSLGAMQPN